MANLGDRVQESTNTVGTGTIALGGAVLGYRSFNSSFTNGTVVFYTIDDGAGNWEVGYGTVGTGTLSRDTVLESSNANALVSFPAGTKSVFCTAPSIALLPDQAGKTTGSFLTSNGTTSSWGTLSSPPPIGSVTPNTGAFSSATIGTLNGVLKGTSGSVSTATSSDITTTLGYTPVNKAGDTMTGALNLPSNGLTVGTTQLVASGGNVGIGTGSPSAKLTVVSGTNNGIVVNDGTVNTIIYNTSSTNGSVGTTTNHPMAFYTNNSEKMRIDSSGNVGIGTSSPSAKADVNGTVRVTSQTVPTSGSGLELIFAGATSYLVSYDRTGSSFLPLRFQGSAFHFDLNGGEAMRLDSFGNVGIGTSSPSTKLDVNGTVTATSFSGAGTGLTGTASGLSIGGNAVTASSCSGNAATATTASSCSGNSVTATQATYSTLLNGTAQLCGYSTSGATVAYVGVGGPQHMDTAGGAAMVTFHRAGAFAVNFGLDTDNQLKLGGYSMGANSYVVHSDYNCGRCRAWVRFTGTNGAIVGSYNVSSVSRTAVGTYTVNFTTAMPSAAYGAALSGGGNTSTICVACRFTSDPTTTAFYMATFNGSGAKTDYTDVYASFFHQ